MRLGQGQVCGDAAFRVQETAVRLQDSGILLRQPVGGETLVDLLAGQDLVRQVVNPAGSERAVEYLAARHADLQRAGDVEHALARGVLQLAPERICATQQRHVRWVLVICQTDDPRQAVGRTHLVRGVEAVDGQDTTSSSRKVVRNCTPHPAGAGDDDVIR